MSAMKRLREVLVKHLHRHDGQQREQHLTDLNNEVPDEHKEWWGITDDE